jgi:hypothetical protein
VTVERVSCGDLTAVCGHVDKHVLTGDVTCGIDVGVTGLQEFVDPYAAVFV